MLCLLLFPHAYDYFPTLIIIFPCLLLFSHGLMWILTRSWKSYYTVLCGQLLCFFRYRTYLYFCLSICLSIYLFYIVLFGQPHWFISLSVSVRLSFPLSSCKSWSVLPILRHFQARPVTLAIFFPKVTSCLMLIIWIITALLY